MWLGGLFQLDRINTASLHLSFPLLSDLRIVLDPTISFTDQVNSVSKSCSHRLCQLHCIRRSLSSQCYATLVHAMIYTWVDFGNAGLSSFKLLSFNLFSKFAHILGFIQMYFIGSLSSSTAYTVQNPFPYAQMSRLGDTWDLSALWSPLYLQGPPCDLLLTVLWLFRSYALAMAQSIALPRLAPGLGYCLPQSLRLELLSLSPLQLQKRLQTFLFAGPSTDAV